MRTEYLPDCEDIRDCIPYFHMLFDGIRIGIIIADANGTIIYYNAAQSEIDNLPIESVLEKHMVEVYEFTLDTSPALQVLTRGSSIIDRVNSYCTRTGNLVNGSCTIYPLYFKNDTIAGVICYTQNFRWLDLQLQNVRQDVGFSSKGTPKSGLSGSSQRYSFASLVGRNEILQRATGSARLAAHNDSAVMLIGETGVGKEIYAQSIHYAGPRQDAPYTAINCSAIPEALLEGILFGTTKGAFTGALNKPGLFELANTGTLFLDEADSMPVGLQGKLLRALQEKCIRRVGEGTERMVDVRVISAVRKNPLQVVEEGGMRPDFYYRLGVIRIFIPPLRERKDDLRALVQHFLEKHSRKMKVPLPGVSKDVMDVLHAHSWPGNIRELEHALEAVVGLKGDGKEIQMEHLSIACPEITAGVACGWPGKRIFMMGASEAAASAEATLPLDGP